MNTFSLFLIAVAFLAVSPARAVQPITMDEEGVRRMLESRQPGPEQQRLESMASGECPAEQCFDGNPILRREAPLVILKEEKVGERRGRWTGGGKHGGRRYRSPTVIYRQTVGIEDRREYVREQRNGGRWKGGFLGGLLGLLGFLAGPLAGIGLLAFWAVAGMDIGGNKAAEEAAAKPRVFERVQEYDKK